MTASPSPDAPGNNEPDRFTSQLQIGSPRWPAFFFLTVLLFGAALFGFLFFTGRLVLRPDPNSPEGKTAALKDLAKKNVEFAQLAENSVNKVSWESTRAKLLSAQSLHNKLSALNAQVKAEQDRLRESGEGKRIASSESWVDQWITIQDRKRLSSDEIDQRLRAIKLLLPVCETALKADVIVQCDERFRREVDSIHDQLAKEVELAEGDQTGIAALLRSSEVSAPAGRSLAQAVAARKEAQQAEGLAKLSEDRERQRQQAEQAAREQKLANEREVENARLAREKVEQAARLAEAEAKAEQARLELRIAEEKREKERLHRERVAKFEAALPGVKSLLSPFISNGRMHYAPGRGWREGDPGPLSLDALQSAGILNDDPTSLSVFTNFCLASPRENDRPLGSFPESTFRSEGSVSQIRRDIQRAQTFLREYGDLLVERRLLQP